MSPTGLPKDTVKLRICGGLPIATSRKYSACLLPVLECVKTSTVCEVAVARSSRPTPYPMESDSLEMDSEAIPRRSDSRNMSTVSPKRLNFTLKRRNNSEIIDEMHQIRLQNESLQKKIADLELEIERLKAEDARNRRRIVDMKAKHIDQIQELTSRLGRNRTLLPETLEAVVSENMASVTTLHKELLDELSSFQAKTERKLKVKEMDLQQNYNAKLAMLGRQLEKRRTLLGNPPDLDELSRDQEPSLETKLLQFEEFNTKLQVNNKALRRKLKEAQALAEVYADQHSNILLENAKLKKLMQERQSVSPMPLKTGLNEELPPIQVQKAKTVTVSPASEGMQMGKIAAMQKELITLKGQLIHERTRKTEVANIIEKCIQDVKAQSISLAAFSGRYKGELTSKERELLVKTLLENERIIELIKTQAFPPAVKPIARSSSVVLFRK